MAETKRIPICWKCASKITAPSKDNSFTLIGCKECKDIKTYSDAEKMCPLHFSPKNKVLIIINGGMAQMEYKPDNVEVEIRDYDTDGVDEEVLTKDEDGDDYQEMIFPATKIVFHPTGSNAFTDVELKYHNYYKCPECGNEWEDEWDCEVDDECGECGCSDISPYKSEEI